LGGGKSVKFSDTFFMENFTLEMKKQQLLRGGKGGDLEIRLLNTLPTVPSHQGRGDTVGGIIGNPSLPPLTLRGGKIDDERAFWRWYLLNTLPTVPSHRGRGSWSANGAVCLRQKALRKWGSYPGVLSMLIRDAICSKL
jgi:hypothetical protein